mgnify:CR=1 FL=1|jgi:hypothetical protein
MTGTEPERDAKAKRPFKKRYLAALLLLLLAVPAVMIAIQVVRISTAVPGVVGDYPQKLRDLIQQQQPENPKGRDGFVIIAEAAQKLDAIQTPLQERIERTGHTEFNNDFKRIRLGPEYLHTPAVDPELYSEEDPLRERVEPFNQLIHAAAREAYRSYRASDIRSLLDTIGPSTPAVITVQDRVLIGTLLPELGPARELARWEAVCMAEDAAQDEWADYHIAAQRMLALADATARTPVLISGLVGYAIEDLLYQRLFADITSRQLPAQTLDAIGRMLQEHAGPTPIRLYFEGEKIIILDIIDRTHSDNGKGDGYFLPASMNALSATNAGPPPGPSIANAPGLIAPSKAETIATVERLYQRWLARAQTPPHQRSDEPLDVDPASWNPVLDIMVPAVSNTITSHDKLVCEHAAIRVAIAIERYRLANAALPASLDDLVPEFIRELPQDPFADDGRLRYRTDEQLSRGYTLYSVGTDAQDDGGQGGGVVWSDDADTVFIPWHDD